VALARAVALGIMVESAGERLRFVHEQVRDAALAALALPERLDAHARAATLWTGPEPEAHAAPSASRVYRCQSLQRRCHHRRANSPRGGCGAADGGRL